MDPSIAQGLLNGTWTTDGLGHYQPVGAGSWYNADGSPYGTSGGGGSTGGGGGGSFNKYDQNTTPPNLPGIGWYWNGVEWKDYSIPKESAGSTPSINITNPNSVPSAISRWTDPATGDVYDHNELTNTDTLVRRNTSGLINGIAIGVEKVPLDISPSGYALYQNGRYIPTSASGGPLSKEQIAAASGGNGKNLQTWTVGGNVMALDANGKPYVLIAGPPSSSGAAPRGIINGPSGGGGGGTSAAERNYLAEQAAQDAAAMERLKYQTGFQGSENALDRQLRAQEAAASEARYQRELQRQLALDYQKALTDVNPNAVRDFLYGSGQAMTAGNGGTFWNALAGGGDALNAETVTPAAQLLGLIRGGGGLNTAASATGTAGVASPTIPYGNDTTATGTPGAPPASGPYSGPGANGQPPSYTRWGGGVSDAASAGTPIPLPNAMTWEEYKAVTPGAMPSQYGAYLAEQAGYGMNTPQYDMQQTGVDQNGVPFTRQVTPEEQAWSEASASGLGGSIAQMNQAMGNYYGAKPTVGGVAVGANATDPFATPSPMQFTPATGQWSRVATSTGPSSNVIQEPKTVVPGLTKAARGTGGLPTRALTIAGDPSRDGVPNPETVTWTPRGNIIQPIRGGMSGVRRLGQRMPVRMFADGGSDYWDPNFDSSIYADTPQTTQPIAKPVTQPISQPPIQPSTGGDVSRPVALSTVSTSSGSSLAPPPAATSAIPSVTSGSSGPIAGPPLTEIPPVQPVVSLGTEINPQNTLPLSGGGLPVSKPEAGPMGTGNTMPGGVPGPSQGLPPGALPGTSSFPITSNYTATNQVTPSSYTVNGQTYATMAEAQQAASGPTANTGDQTGAPTVGGLPATQTDSGLSVPTAGTGSTTVSQGQSDLINEILNQRRTAIVPGLDSSYLDVAFNNIPPSQRAAWYAGMQERYGVDPQDIMAEQQRYALRGYQRGGLVGAVRR